VKVKFTLEQAMKTQKGSRGIAVLFFSLTWTPDGGGWSVPRPGRFKAGKDRRLGRPQSRSRRVRKISAPSGFDPRTVQPVASPCTNYTIVAHVAIIRAEKLHNQIPATVVVITIVVDEHEYRVIEYLGGSLVSKSSRNARYIVYE